MRFGTTLAVAPAVARVGRDASLRAPQPGPRLRTNGSFDPFAMPASRGGASVRVGRDARALQDRPPSATRVGQTPAELAALAANSPGPNFVPGFGFIPLVGCAANYDWTQACVRTNGVPRTSIAAGATTPLSVTTCGPSRVLCIVVPESFALLFQITQITICRDNFITIPIPAEALSDQGDYACLGLGCGSVFFASQPLVISVQNISGAAAFFSAMVVTQEMNMC